VSKPIQTINRYKADLREFNFLLFEQFRLGELLSKEPFDAWGPDEVKSTLSECYRWVREVTAGAASVRSVGRPRQTSVLRTDSGSLTCRRAGVSILLKVRIDCWARYRSGPSPSSTIISTPPHRPGYCPRSAGPACPARLPSPISRLTGRPLLDSEGLIIGKISDVVILPAVGTEPPRPLGLVVTLQRRSIFVNLGRIAETGSVHVEALFEVERYPTLLQMTSTISAQLRDDVRLEAPVMDDDLEPPVVRARQVAQ